MKNLEQAIDAVATRLGTVAYYSAMNGDEPWHTVNIVPAAIAIAAIYDEPSAEIFTRLTTASHAVYYDRWGRR